MRVRSLCIHGPYSITKKVVAVLLFKSAANLPLCVGSTVITARRLMKGVVSAFRLLPQLRQPAAELCRADRKCARQSVSACRISRTACHTTMLWCCGSAFPRRRSEFKPVALHRCTTPQPSTDSAVVWSHNAVSGGSGFHCFRPSIRVVCKRHAFVRT